MWLSVYVLLVILCFLVSDMQALLQEIMASPGLMESLLSGPYIRILLDCLSQNNDLAAQVRHNCGFQQNRQLLRHFISMAGKWRSLLVRIQRQNAIHADHSFWIFQMLLSHPLFTGNPHLKQQMKQQLPLFLQQVWWTYCMFLSYLRVVSHLPHLV